MKKKSPVFRAFTLSACWIIQLFLIHPLPAQEEPPEPDPEDEEAPFSVVYHVLPDMPGSYQNFAYAINNKGEIAGEAGFLEFPGPAGVVWFPTEVEEAYTPTYSAGGGLDINDNGDVAPGMDYVFDYEVSSSENDTTTRSGYGFAINNSKQVIGWGGETKFHQETSTSGPDGGTTSDSWSTRTATFPAEIRPPEVRIIGQGSQTIDTYSVNNEGEATITGPSSRYRGTAWSIDEQGYCVGIDSGGSAVWQYGGSYRKKPAGCKKRLISISREGIVCGTSDQGPTLWPKHGEDKAIVLPLPEDAGAGDNFATAASDTGWVVGQVGGSIKENAEHEWKGGRAFAWKQERVDDKGKTVWTMMDLAKYAPKGWKHLTIYDVNRSGRAVGFAQIKGKYCAVVIELGPQLIAVDANRDGVTRFEDDEKIVSDLSLSDLTTPEKPFRFWLNDDEDTIDGKDNQPITRPNYNDDEINGIRDLEDFYRIKIRWSREMELKLKRGYQLKLSTKGGIEINIFKAVVPENDPKNETAYLKNLGVARKQAQNKILTPEELNDLQKVIKKIDHQRREMSLLWEGVKSGKGELILSLCRSDGKVEITSKISLDLHFVTEFYEGAETKFKGTTFLPPYRSGGYIPDLFTEIIHKDEINWSKGEQSAQAIIFVHGWRMPEQEALNWGEIMYKRLWHAGYRGRFFFFKWFTYSPDESDVGGFFTYNKSEHRAYIAGKLLAEYIKIKRSTLPPECSISMCAHSMGNVVAGEAIKRGAPVERYVMMQAAVSASCYDDRKELRQDILCNLELGEHRTPQSESEMGYVGYFKNNSIALYNFYNESDFAMKLYLADQVGFKPDTVEVKGGGQYAYLKAQKDGKRVPGIYKGLNFHGLQREILEPYECMAFLARSLTLPIGSEPRTLLSHGRGIGSFKKRVDLGKKFGFGFLPWDHSAQFNKPIQDKVVPFYVELMSCLEVEKEAP